MAVEARHIEPWEMDDIDCTETYRTVEETVRDDSGEPVLIEIDDGEGGKAQVPKKIVRYERRKHFVLKLRRTVVGVIRFMEDTGKSRSGFSMLTGPDTGINYISSSRRWRCTRDAIQKDRMEVGSCNNEQTWEFYSKWEKIGPNDFGGGE